MIQVLLFALMYVARSSLVPMMLKRFSSINLLSALLSSLYALELIYAKR